MRLAGARALVAALVLSIVPGTVSAEERFALIVSGASGGEEYAGQYARWVSDFRQTLATRLAFDPANVTVLAEREAGPDVATAENIRHALAAVRQRMARADVLVILLIGHGTYDGSDAKFNLVGRDLESAEWAALLDPLPGTVVLVNTAGGSFPFLERLRAPRRIVITATDSDAQRFDTVFPEYFVRAFVDEGADLDKNQRISIWEAFAFASAGVRRHYQQRGLLATERSLLDDTGDGRGKGAAEEGPDGTRAGRTYLDASRPGAAPTDDALLKLLQRKSLLEAELDELRIRKAFLPPAEYAAEFERIIVQFSRVSAEIRARTKT